MERKEKTQNDKKKKKTKTKKMGAKHELKAFYRVGTLFIGFEIAPFEWPFQTFKLFLFSPNITFNSQKH